MASPVLHDLILTLALLPPFFTYKDTVITLATWIIQDKVLMSRSSDEQSQFHLQP